MNPKTLLSLLAATGAFLNAEMASAQSLPPSVRTPEADKTLGTQVAGNGNNFNITGGLNRGQTLFHSFKDFSIPTGGAANFNNPAGTRDIISRVTGNLFSDINGTLNSNGANFLLINPNGVVFGPNARLNVGKAFAASTASGVDLIDGQGRQVTFGTNPNGDAPLLKINPNVFFNVSRLNLGASVPNNPGIVNYGTLQTNNDSQYIGLIGGNVTLNGGKVIAPGGRIDLGGLTSAGTVSTESNGLVFGGNNLTYGNVELTNKAAVSVRATQPLAPVVTVDRTNAIGGNINVKGNNVSLLDAGEKQSITKSAGIDAGLELNSGNQTIAAGNININATGLVSLNNSSIQNTLRSGASGQIGDVNIQANSLNLSDSSLISTIIAGTGSGGNIGITTTGDVSISGISDRSLLDKNTNAILIPFLEFANLSISSITSNTQGQGNAGKISIDTQGKLLLSNLAEISSSVRGQAVGNGGDISVSAKSIDLRNQGVISAINRVGNGNAGNINIKTTGDISISGSTPESTKPITANSKSSYISSDTTGKGNAGKITIDTQNLGELSLSNRGNITNSIGKNAVGNGNDITISAKSIDLRNDSFISSSNFGGKGDGGNINITTSGDISISGNTPQLTDPITPISNQSSILSSNFGQGKTGDILLGSDRLTLNEGTILATSGEGKGGNVQLTNRDLLLLRNSSFIATSSASTDRNGNGGNISINSPLIIALPGNNDIAADAVGGNGGKLDIASQGLFGIKYRPKGQESDFTNDITSSSTFGQSGIVNISTPGSDPGKDSTVLPTVPTDASNQIAQTCNASRENKFIIAGRGGLPPNANDPLTSDVVWQDSRAANNQPTASSTTNDPNKLPPPAVGLVVDGKGKAFLIAAGTEGQPTKTTVTCPNVVKK
jgi:filamentous hemagglutinin family protein